MKEKCVKCGPTSLYRDSCFCYHCTLDDELKQLNKGFLEQIEKLSKEYSKDPQPLLRKAIIDLSRNM